MGIVAISRRRADAGLHRANRDNPTYTFNYRATAQAGTGDAGQGLYGGGGTSTAGSGANTPGETPCSGPAADLGRARGRISLQSLRSPNCARRDRVRASVRSQSESDQPPLPLPLSCRLGAGTTESAGASWVVSSDPGNGFRLDRGATDAKWSACPSRTSTLVLRRVRSKPNLIPSPDPESETHST